MPKFPKPYFRSQRGTWCVQIAGKQITLGPDKEEAFREYHRLMAADATPAPSASNSHSLVVSVLDQYLDWLAKRVEEGTKARRTYQWYLKYLQSFCSFKSLEYRISDLTVEALGPVHVYRWVDSHPSWKTGRRGAIIALQRAMNWAARAGLLKSIGGKSPLSSLEKPAQGRREQLVTEAEYREVLATLSRQEHIDLIELSWETGMRPHELFTCEARFLDVDNGRLVFPIHLSKGKKVQCVVYLNDRALPIVRRLASRNPQGPMLRNTDGLPWKPASVNCLFQRVRRDLGRMRLERQGLPPPKIPRLKAWQRKEKALRAGKHSPNPCWTSRNTGFFTPTHGFGECLRGRSMKPRCWSVAKPSTVSPGSAAPSTACMPCGMLSVLKRWRTVWTPWRFPS